MPLRVTDQTHWCHSTPGRRWARQDSGDLIGHARQRSLRRDHSDRRGREPNSSPSPPARLPRHRHNRRTIYNLATPPQTHVRKKLEPRPDRGSRHRLEWIASGCTAQCFWTGPRRWIAALASRLRCKLRGQRTLTGSTESVEVFSRRPSRRAAMRN